MMHLPPSPFPSPLPVSTPRGDESDQPEIFAPHHLLFEVLLRQCHHSPSPSPSPSLPPALLPSLLPSSSVQSLLHQRTGGGQAFVDDVFRRPASLKGGGGRGGKEEGVGGMRVPRQEQEAPPCPTRTDLPLS